MNELILNDNKYSFFYVGHTTLNVAVQLSITCVLWKKEHSFKQWCIVNMSKKCWFLFSIIIFNELINRGVFFGGGDYTKKKDIHV